MAHYKDTEKGQGLFLAVNLSEQIVPGTFEHTLDHLIGQKLDCMRRVHTPAVSEKFEKLVRTPSLVRYFRTVSTKREKIQGLAEK